jgi:signal transduction histidine kinase
LREIAGEAGLEGQRLDQAWPELAGILAASQGRGQVARLVAGQERTFDVLVSDLLGRGATAHGQALILRDDTDRRLVGQLQESREQIIGELRRANTQLTKLDELKSDLISNVAHELRAPLSSIRAFAELLMDAELDEVTRSEFTRIVHEESERLTRLVTSVLDMSRIDSGSIEWRPQPVDLGKALGDCVIAFQPAADAKGLELRLDLQAGVPAAQVDPDGLRQVVTNLISNAIKFTDHGEVLVRAEERDGEVTISVRDTGRGIPEEERQQIFERFYQVGDVLASKPQGSGLGLAIVSEILKQHGTDIELESASGAGSRFSFSLPAAGVLAR